MTNHQPTDPPTAETSLPERMSDCRSPVEQALWRALKIAREERDEARREICINEANELAYDLERKGVFGITGKSMAEKRGWDCFKEDTK